MLTAIDKGVMVIVVICTMILFVILGYFGFFQGPEKESLLEFTCEELKDKTISQDGEEGRFVTDVWTKARINNTRINAAMIEKGCIQKSNITDIFDYRYVEGYQ